MTRTTARLVAAALAVPALCATSSKAQVPGRFQLFNDCKPMGLAIGSVFDDVQALGIGKENVEAAVESRLRVARLYTTDAPAFLYVLASRYAIQLQYRKPVRDLASEETRSIPTYARVAEVRDGTAAGILLEIAKLLDLFLVDYLKVNDDACGQAGATGETSLSEPSQTTESPPKRAPRPRLLTHDDQPRHPRRPGSENPDEADDIHWSEWWPPPPEEPNGEDEEPRTYTIGGGVTSPRLLYKVEPEYSEKARNAKLQGTVMLSIEVWEDGKAHNIRVLRPLGMGLDEKAIEAARQWKFVPGKKDGRPVKVAAQIQMTFKLLDSDG